MLLDLQSDTSVKLKVKLKSPVKIQSHAAEMKHRRWDETCLAEMKLNHRWIETRMTNVIEGFTSLGTSTVDKADVVHGSYTTPPRTWNLNTLGRVKI